MSNEEETLKFEDGSPIIRYIEERYGKYEEKPQGYIMPNLYERYGYFAATLISNKKPAHILIDERLLEDEYNFIKSLVHELFEWRFVEDGQKYPHASAVKATREFLSHFDIRPKAFPLINSLFPNVGNLLERLVDLKGRAAKRILRT